MGQGPRQRFLNNALSPLFDRGEDFCHHFIAWSCTEIAFAVNADADSVGLHIAVSDDEHGVDFHLFGVGDLRSWCDRRCLSDSRRSLFLERIDRCFRHLRHKLIARFLRF